jgi:hypothetical protein
MATPPPPNYAPTAGRTTWWTGNGAAASATVTQVADAIWTPERITAAEAVAERTAAAAEATSRYLTEAPEQRHRREREEHRQALAEFRERDDAARAKAGETPRQRKVRHQREDRQQRADERALDARHKRDAQIWASMPWKLHNAERVRRFRRWCAMTVLSASLGCAVHLVQWCASLGAGAYAVLGAGWVLDTWLRTSNGRHLRVAEATGGRRALLLITRVPFASALGAVCGLSPLLVLSGHLFHHH